jgi:small subunit ribosomal protein S29
MKDSAYRNAAFDLIHAHDLAIVNWFMSHLSGASPLPNGGMVLAATTESNSPSNPSLDIAIRELEFPPSQRTATPYPETEQLTFGYNPNFRNPFIKYDQRVLDVFARPGMELQRLKGLSKDEARSLMEYWAKSGLVRQKVNETLVGEKWALSGGGVVGELERATVRMKI